MTDPQAPQPPPVPPEEKSVSLGDILGGLLGGGVFVVVLGVGVANILAALGLWNPLQLQGRLWTGVFLVAAPTTVVLITTLPLRIRQRIPESVAAVVTLGLWAGFFWAACGGR